MNIKQTIKDWMLPIAMTVGATSYLIYHSLPQLHSAGPFLDGLVDVLQPLLIFTMLFLTFCRIEPQQLKPHRWHWWLLLIQGGVFVLVGLAASTCMRLFPFLGSGWMVIAQSFMLCTISPTATAAAVVTRKLGGDVPGLTTYIILINMLTAVLVPLVVPMVHPQDGMSFWVAFSMIMAKVFPLLILPCLAAWLVRYLFPKVHARLVSWPDLPFYIWSVALSVAICVTTRSIVHSSLSWWLLGGIALVSLVCCIFHFAAGRKIGSMYGRRAGKLSKTITAGQALGQKNTIFTIWMGYTFMMPETAIVGGFYSIWHNIYNSRQLYRSKCNISQE
jgi:BASS family bile acid:Na+ symporter